MVGYSNACVRVFLFNAKQNLAEQKQECDQKKTERFGARKILKYYWFTCFESSSSSGILSQLKQFNSHNSEYSKRSNIMFSKQPRKNSRLDIRRIKDGGRKLARWAKFVTVIHKKVQLNMICFRISIEGENCILQN